MAIEDVYVKQVLDRLRKSGRSQQVGRVAQCQFVIVWQCVEHSHPIHIVENAIDKKVSINRVEGSSFWEVFNINRRLTSSCISGPVAPQLIILG